MPHSTTAGKRLPWPNGAKAAISITMDNMAEAADIHRGVIASDAPLGKHHSTTTQLPRMLSLLKSKDIKATYFIEAWNNSHYSDLIKQVLAEGHEVGFHAWQHEVWKLLDQETELANLNRSVDDAEKHLDGYRYKGFRPPGGLVTDRTLKLLKERGFTYLSPAAERCAVVEGVAMVPFAWPDIDAYFYMDSTAPLREGRGESKGTISPQQMKERLIARIDRVIEEGGFISLLNHPFLTDSEEKHRVMEEVMEHVKQKEKEGLWVAQCKDVAEWVLKHPEEFGDDPGWDRAEWKKK